MTELDTESDADHEAPPTEETGTDDASIPSSACAPCSIVHIHVDADRDGAVDTMPGGSAWMSTSGAIVCVNCDNDEGQTNADPLDNLDSANDTISNAADLAEIAPFDLRKTSKLPLTNMKVVLSLETTPLEFRDYLRIFDKRTVGAKEIIGPTTGAEHTFTEADFTNKKIELGMEALRFPSRSMGPHTVDFDGIIKLKLDVKDPGGATLHSETVPVRVAPWIVFNHTDVTEKVYVAEISSGRSPNNGIFIPELRAILGSKLEVIPLSKNNHDRWAQDVMEIGYSKAPNHDLVTVIRTPRLRGRGAGDRFGQYASRELLGADFGYYLTNTLGAGSSLDSFGNLECSPPIPGFPFGRIIYGEPATPGHSPIKEEMRALLEGQGLQSPVKLDTGWLLVGHVDEFMSFIPDTSGTHGFKIAFANPELAVDIVRSTQATHPRTELLKGIRANYGPALSRRNLNSIGYRLNTTDSILADSSFLDIQDDVQVILETQKDALKTELGLADSDFIDMPFLFNQNSGQYIAYTPGSVNMLVVTHSSGNIDLVIPKPFGPVVGGACQFEASINASFAGNSAVTIYYVDCFLTYHVLQGEIHCGTNTKRVPPTRNWWH